MIEFGILFKDKSRFKTVGEEITIKDDGFMNLEVKTEKNNKTTYQSFKPETVSIMWISRRNWKL